MKIFSFFLLLISPIVAQAQLDSMLMHGQPTSLEEYNYLTKGYRIQTESGLDMKKGYSFQDIGDHEVNSYHFTLKKLVRDSTQELAGILIITYSGSSNKTYYTCIPINNAELMNMYTKEIAKWDRNISAAYLFVISSYLASFFYGHTSPN